MRRTEYPLLHSALRIYCLTALIVRGSCTFPVPASPWKPLHPPQMPWSHWPNQVHQCWTGHSPCPLGLWLTLHLYECLHECVVCMHGFFARLDLSDQNCEFSLKPNDALHNNLSLVGELRTVTFPSSIPCFSIRESIFAVSQDQQQHFELCMMCCCKKHWSDECQQPQACHLQLYSSFFYAPFFLYLILEFKSQYYLINHHI